MENTSDTQDELDQYGVWVKTPPQDAAEEAENTETPVPEANKEEEVSLDSLADGEVSLDEFLTNSDTSQDSEIDVSAFLGDDSQDAPGDKNFQPDGEISLDAFLDESDLGGESQEQSQENYDAPIDIDLSFDDSMPEVSEDEPDISSDDIDLDSFMAEDSETDQDNASTSLDDSDEFDELFNNIEDTSPQPEQKQELPKADTESVDLSEFGVTGEDMEVTSMDEGKPEKKVQQDYNLNVDDDSLGSGSDAVGGESADEDISINMEVKSDNGKALEPDEKNPYSAPDDDFDIDGLLNSIEDETDSSKTEPTVTIPQSEQSLLPKNDNEETQIIVTDPEDDGVSMSIPDNAVESEELQDYEESVSTEREEIPPAVETSDIFEKDPVDIFSTDETPVSEDVSAESEPLVEQEMPSEDTMEPEPQAEEQPPVETENCSVDDFMGEEGFSDPSVAEGNRSYSPEELEEQKKLEEEKTEEDIDDFATEVDRENADIDKSTENDVNLVNQLEKEMTIVDLDGDGEDDADLIIDASEGGTSNEILEDEDFMPNPFYTPLVEDEGVNTPQVKPEDDEEELILEDSEENSQETVAEIENKSNNSIVADDGIEVENVSDAAGDNMDSTLYTNTQEPQDSLMSQIASELSNLKEEIKELKLEFDELRKNGFSSGSDGVSDSIPAPEAETGFFSDMDDDDTIALSGDELSNILSTAEFTDQNDAGDSNILGSIEEAPEIPDQDYDNAQNGLSMDYSDENLQEPDLNSVDVSSDAMGLPEEISVPKSDDSIGSEPEPLDQQVDNSITEDNFEYLSEDPNSVAEEDEKIETGISDEPVRTVFNDWQNPNEDASSFEEPEIAGEEPAVDDTSFDQTESIVDLSSQEDNSMEEISEPVVATTSSGSISSIPEDMKQEIKSVLSYMDQLLESLPEDKIEEFARSEQFATYKKLFNELGLS